MVPWVKLIDDAGPFTSFIRCIVYCLQWNLHCIFLFLLLWVIYYPLDLGMKVQFRLGAPEVWQLRGKGRGERGLFQHSIWLDEKWTANTQFWNQWWSLTEQEWNHCVFLLLSRRGKIVVIIYRFTRGEIWETSWHPVTRGEGEKGMKRIVIWLMNETRLDSIHLMSNNSFPLNFPLLSPDFCSLSSLTNDVETIYDSLQHTFLFSTPSGKSSGKDRRENEGEVRSQWMTKGNAVKSKGFTTEKRSDQNLECLLKINCIRSVLLRSNCYSLSLHLFQSLSRCVTRKGNSIDRSSTWGTKSWFFQRNFV